MLSPLEKAVIRKLQEDLPVEEAPFDSIARELGIGTEEVLKIMESLEERRVMRRLGAILHHRQAGYKANAMVVWAVPQGRIDEAASVMCRFKEVSHCYRRPTYPDWPFSLFSMIHGQTPEECEKVIAKIAEETSLEQYEILYSTRELKKCSMKYFEKDE